MIEQGSASTGYRTILGRDWYLNLFRVLFNQFNLYLGYWADGYDTRVNYYSNPNIAFPITGTPTGVEGIKLTFILTSILSPF